jgi:hypothetical protein
MSLNLIADKKWRLSNLYKIVDKTGSLVTFQVNEIQAKVAREAALRQTWLKARQFGFSTYGIIDMFDDTIFTRNTTSVILAHEKDSIQKLFRIARRAYDNLPKEFQPVLDRGGGSKYEMYFPEINSRIYCDLESRGDTIQRLHVSEAAFMKDSARLKSTLQAVPMTGKVRIETTPNGMGNHYYDLWIDPDAPYKKMFFPWYSFSEYKIESTEKIVWSEDEVALAAKALKYGVKITDAQIRFRRLKKSELKASASDITKVTFEQEYPEDDVSCFLSSGDAVMDLFEINKMLQAAPAPIRDEGWLKIYYPHSKSERYVLGADTAEGVGGDSSVAVLIAVGAKKIVAKIKSNQWKPGEFAHKINDLCKMYFYSPKGWPLVGVERNNHGHSVLLELGADHINYPNLYQHEDEKIGWRTDKVSRPIMLNTFISAIEDKYLVVTDKEVLGECLTLVNNDGKIEAASGKHDDCIIATSIAFQLLIKQGPHSIYEDIEKKILY